MKRYTIEKIGWLELKKPLEVVVEYDEENQEWMVGSEELDVSLWGFGETEEEARHEFVRELLLEAIDQYRKKIDGLKQWLDERIKEADEKYRSEVTDWDHWLTRKRTFEEVRRWLDETGSMQTS